MSRLSRNGWTWSQLLEEWEYRYQERLGILCGAAEPEPWMVQMAEREAQAAVDELIKRPVPAAILPPKPKVAMEDLFDLI